MKSCCNVLKLFYEEILNKGKYIRNIVYMGELAEAPYATIKVERWYKHSNKKQLKLIENKEKVTEELNQTLNRITGRR
jgi:hypothetical protein